MTIDWTRKRKLPRLAVFALRGVGLLVLAAALLIDLYLLHYNWHHFELVERDGWIADYARIKNLLETRYPNLDWVVTEARLDLHRLDARTTARLEEARTREDAERALRDFLRAFHDGHLGLRRPEPETATDRRRRVTVISSSTPPEKACEFLEYEETDEPDFAFEFAGAAAFRQLPAANAFDAGVLRLDGRTFGMLRIPTFDTWENLPTCISEWDRFRKTIASTCEDECANDFHRAMTARLLDDFSARVRDLRAAGAEALIVDVTGNGGGYTSLRFPMTTLLAGRQLPQPFDEVVAGEDTVASLEADRRRLETALALCPTASPARAGLEADYRSIDLAIAEAAIPCDRSSVWSDWGVRPPCTGVVAFQGLDDRTTAELESTSAILRTRRNESLPAFPRRAHWRGPLLVLTNRHTGSSAEILAGVLQDYTGATVIGQRSSGSGGGWTFGRTFWTLDTSRLDFCLPDHTSYRRDGTNYMAGVRPSISARFEPADDGQTKARALVAGLRARFLPEKGR